MFLLTVLNEKYFWFNLSTFEPGVKSETNICKKKKKSYFSSIIFWALLPIKAKSFQWRLEGGWNSKGSSLLLFL